jgi:hypothetical protein
MNKAVSIVSLLVAVQATSTPSLLRDNQPSAASFPLYSTATAATATNAAVMQLSQTSVVKYGGYQCIRKGEIYAPPQKVETTGFTVQADSSNTLKMFYYADSNGASLGNALTPANNHLDSGCSENLTFATPNVSAGYGLIMSLAGNGKEILNRVYYRGPYALADVSITAGQNNVITWNNDFLLAAQWQNGVLSGAT